MNEIDKASINKTLFDLQQKESRIDRLITLCGFMIQAYHSKENGDYMSVDDGIIQDATTFLDKIEKSCET